MRKALLIASLILTCGALYSQTVFNRIITDTANHIMSSVIALDTGYVYLTGTYNTNVRRCFSLNYIDLNGNHIWKRLPPTSDYEIWEGWANNFHKYSNTYSLSSDYGNPELGLSGTHISIFDSSFNLQSTDIFLNDTVWKRTFHHTRTKNGDYFLTGQVYNYEEQKYRLYLVKIDSSLNLCWQKEFGNYAYEYGSFVMATSFGSILIGGNTRVTGSNNSRWYLINTDTAGNIIWERYYGRTNFANTISALIETHDSCYLACGVYPAAKYGSGGGTYLWDGCLRKINQDGELVWTKYYRSYSKLNTGQIYLHNKIYSIIYNNNDLYTLGSERINTGRLRGYLQKITENGDICWKREYYAIDSNSNDQYLKVFKPTADNGFILAGYGDYSFTHGYSIPQLTWLVKTDSLGLDGLSNVELPELNIDIEFPDTLCLGDTLSVYAYISGKSAPYTIEFSTGQVIDSIYYPPTFVPVSIGLTEINLTWGGSTYFSETITEATLTNHEWGQCIAKPVEFYVPQTEGLQQIYITVTDAYGESKTISKEILVENCSVNKKDFSTETISIYPNPANNVLTICLPPNINTAIASISDLSGKNYGFYDLNTNKTEIDISNLKSGKYFLQVKFKDKIENFGFVKE